MHKNPSLSFGSQPSICPNNHPTALQMVFTLSASVGTIPALLSAVSLKDTRVLSVKLEQEE